jgi:hypothetical protein
VTVFPEDTLGVMTELGIGGVMTDVTQYALTRNIITHTRGQSDERGSVNPASCSLLLRSPRGLFSPRNPRSEYFEKIGLNTPEKTSVRVGQQRLHLPADAPTARISTPSVSALNIAGDLDVRLDAALTDWVVGQELELCGKFLTTGDQRSWQLSVDAAGRIALRASTSGAAVVSYPSTVALPARPYQRLAIRVTRASATGVLTFYTAATIAGPWTQLGETVTSPSGAIYASAAELTVGDLGTLALTAPSGSVYAFQLRDGIGGTLVASPDFTAVAIGATSFVDDSGRTWSVADGAEINNKRVRSYTEFSDWPAEWSGRPELIVVDGEGVGILERLSQGRRELASTLRRRVPAYAPVAYWPMEEGADAATISSPVAGVRAFRPAAFDMASDDSLPGSSPLPVVQVGGAFVAPVPPTAPAGTWQVELVYRLEELPVATTTMFEVWTTGTARKVRVRISSTSVSIDGLDVDDSSVFSQSALPTEFTGAWARLQIRAVQSGGNVTYSVRWIIIGGAGWSTGATIAAAPGRVTDIRSSFGTGLDGMSFGHLTLFSTNTDTPFNGADQAFNGERAGDRMIRLCAEEGVPFTLSGAAADTVRLGPQRPGTLLNLLQECASTDGGILAEERERLGLRYRPRTSLYNQTPSLTLAYGTRGISLGRPVEPDSSFVRNDVTVNLPGGGFARATLDTGRMSVLDPPNGVGPYEETYDLNLHGEDDAPAHANWRLSVATWDEARYPSITIKPHRAPQLIDSILGLAEGDLVRVTDLPDHLPPGPLDLLVVGYREQLGTHTWVVELVCVPAGPYQVGVADDPVRGLVDSRSSTLATGVDSTAASLSVAVASGLLWVHQVDFNIVVGGEEMTVTNVTGASSPQTFTVVRAANSVTKFHLANAPVHVARPARVALGGSRA